MHARSALRIGIALLCVHVVVRAAPQMAGDVANEAFVKWITSQPGSELWDHDQELERYAGKLRAHNSRPRFREDPGTRFRTGELAERFKGFRILRDEDLVAKPDWSKTNDTNSAWKNPDTARRCLKLAGGEMAGRVMLSLTLASVIAATLSAQPPARWAFDAASVKPSKSAAPAGPGGNFSGATFTAVNVPLLQLIRQAYQVQGFQIVGGPSWITSDRFDIVAKMPSGPQSLPRDAAALMIQSLLADRFKLTTHNETRILPVYALVMARGDGKPGPQFHQPAVDCYALLRPDAPQPLPSGFFCGGLRPGRGEMSGRSASMRQLALFLAPQVGRIVLDETGISGTFDIDLTWTPGLIASDASAGSPADSGTSIYTALQEELGLKLESQQGPVDVIVIDHVEQPTGD